MRTSSELDKISDALALAQASFDVVEKNKVNPYFNSKFADLSSVIAATRPALAANGLCFSQSPYYTDNRVIVISRLIHKSGQWLENEVSLKPLADNPQAIGSTITYGRRYGLSSLLGVCADDDDDGNEASKGTAIPVRSMPTQPRSPGMGVASQARISKMIDAFKEFSIDKEDLTRFTGRPSLSNITEKDVQTLSDMWQRIKSGDLEVSTFKDLCNVE